VSRLDQVERPRINEFRKTLVITDIGNQNGIPLFLIETIDEEGENDGGYYSVRIHGLVDQGLATGSSTSPPRSYFGTFTRQMVASGDGSNSLVTDIGSSVNPADNPVPGDVGAISMQATEQSEYLTEVRLIPELLGVDISNEVAVVSVQILHLGFVTPPRIIEVSLNNAPNLNPTNTPTVTDLSTDS
jgi:hypothetical protein